MMPIIAIFAVFMAVAVYFAAVRHAICLRGLLVVSAAVAAFGAYALLVAPSDFLMPWQEVSPTLFHPWTVGGCGVVAFVCFVSLSSGLLARCVAHGVRSRREGR